MHQILISPKDSKGNIMLSYNTKEAVDIAQKNIHERMRQEDTLLTAKDDFGYVLEMQVNNISYVLLVDLNTEQDVIVQSAIARQKASMDLYEKYKNDPATMQLLSGMQQQRSQGNSAYQSAKPKLEIQ